ncbi:MAG: CoA transferase [Caulobacterales bacterium]|nr:CoA transferase [Caulobacterales bacterium]
MSAIAPALERLQAEIAARSAAFGRPVDVASLRITDRAGELPLGEPGLVSPNGACRLVRAADGWMAVNLAREEDRDLIPAWLECGLEGEPWALIAAHAPGRTVGALVEAATLLGLPAGRVGEVEAQTLEAPTITAGAAGAPRRPLRVVDLSALWAGPLCGAVLAAAGARVTKVESERRPDPTRTSTPDFFQRLNGAKAELALDLAAPEGQARLRELIAGADVLITSVRPRALPSLGLSVAAVFGENPALTWVAITGYGWTGPGAQRVAFGDDAAAAGGLVRWTADGEPRFMGDALSDPVTGLAAASGALRAVAAGGGVIVDAALARCAAGAAALCQPRAAA